jgi:hypothetical protein
MAAFTALAGVLCRQRIGQRRRFGGRGNFLIRLHEAAAIATCHDRDTAKLSRKALFS